MKDTEELIKKFITGNEEAFETLVLSHRSSAQEFAKRYVNNFHIAEDLVQDAFVSCYINRAKYKHSHTFKTYLYTIIRNKCVDYIRKENRKLLYEISNENISISPEEKLIKKESLTSLKKSINALYKPYKQAIYLVDIEECSYKDAAHIMDKSLTSFKVTLFRARKQLKEELSKEVYHESR